MSRKKRSKGNAEFERMRQVIKASHVVYCPLAKDYIDKKECRTSGCELCEEWR